MRSYAAYHERPITSERAELVREVCPNNVRAIQNLLGRGHATLLAVAIAYYGGDIVAAKRELYGIETP